MRKTTSINLKKNSLNSYWYINAVFLCLLFLVTALTAQVNTSSNLLAQDSILIPASTEYKNGTFQKIAYGNRYRNSWRTPVKMPIFNLQTSAANKLEIVKLGGGMSTKTFRLEGIDGREYVLRSVYKSGRRGVPDQFKNSVYEDVLQDLRVGGHPFSALPIAPLAEAADLYHTNPKIYYLPQQEGLGEYNEAYGNELYLFEEHPNEGWNLSSFGYADKIIGYDKLLEKVQETPKNQVDEEWVLKSRLFDIWIGDYDRNDDQWRWAAFPDTVLNMTLYRPIPRDRDQALYDINGVVPWVLSRDFIHIQQHPFAGNIQDMKEFVSNSKYFDRAWLTELDWATWEIIALTLQSKLTDETIEKAFEVWPEPIYQFNAPSLIKRLKKRRDRMVIHAKQFYKLLAKYVNVVGTSKRELFEINQIDKNNLEVTVYALNKHGEKKTAFYHRTFHAKETKEIRLYGLEGEDQFQFVGVAKNPIIVRIIGGKDVDTIQQNTLVPLGRKVVVYDDFKGIDVSNSSNIDLELSDDPAVNEYNREEFQYDNYFPLITFGSTTDDGFFLGGGVNFTNYGFRKKPYGAKHHVFLQFSPLTSALRIDYWSDFTEAIGGLNFNPTISFDRPIIFNYFGLGNNTKILSDNEQFHWIRLKQFKLAPLLKKLWLNNKSISHFGPFFENVIVERRAGRISDAPGFLTDADRGNKSFLGLLFKHQFNGLDNNALSTKGIRYNVELTYYRNLNEEQAYGRLSGSVSNFFTLTAPFKITVGNRIGAAVLSDNNYYFFHNNNLGENNFLRGFRNNRYAGRSIFYHNIDVRIPLFFYKSYIAPGEIGLLGGFDYGRAWSPNANEGGLKSALSGGIWWTPYRFTAINAFFTRTGNGEKNTFTLRMGHFF